VGLKSRSGELLPGGGAPLSLEKTISVFYLNPALSKAATICPIASSTAANMPASF
jgi:hypothetical protein